MSTRTYFAEIKIASRAQTAFNFFPVIFAKELSSGWEKASLEIELH
jgi:hypothetical protein